MTPFWNGYFQGLSQCADGTGGWPFLVMSRLIWFVFGVSIGALIYQ